MGQPLPINIRPCFQLITIQHTLVGQHIEVSAVNERRRHVRTSCLLAPCHILARALPLSETDVTRGPCANNKDWASGRRPLATTIRSPEKIGVGAVILELPPSRHSSLPV